MRNARAVKKELAVEPSPLELIEIAQGIPFNQNELTVAWASLAYTKETAKEPIKLLLSRHPLLAPRAVTLPREKMPLCLQKRQGCVSGGCRLLQRD